MSTQPLLLPDCWPTPGGVRQVSLSRGNRRPLAAGPNYPAATGGPLHGRTKASLWHGNASRGHPGVNAIATAYRSPMSDAAVLSKTMIASYGVPMNARHAAWKSPALAGSRFRREGYISGKIIPSRLHCNVDAAAGRLAARTTQANDEPAALSQIHMSTARSVAPR